MSNLELYMTATEDAEGKYSVLSVFSWQKVTKNIHGLVY